MAEWSPDDLSKDDAYSLLAEEHRRVALRLLLNEQETWDLDALASAIIAREEDLPPGEVGEAHHERVLLALRHRDIPKLAEADVVEFHVEEETVRVDENIDDLESLIG